MKVTTAIEIQTIRPDVPEISGNKKFIDANSAIKKADMYIIATIDTKICAKFPYCSFIYCGRVALSGTVRTIFGPTKYNKMKGVAAEIA